MSHYSFSKYVYPSRWTSYWHQVHEVLETAPVSVLVIGKGDGIVGDVLKKEGLSVTVLDIDPQLSPDLTGSVEAIPAQDASYDAILCAEVLEHLPFEKFNLALKELHRVSRRHVILSLPHFGPPIQFSFKFPLFRGMRISVRLPFYHPRHRKGGEHYWEIGKAGFPPSLVRRHILKHFSISSEFVPFDNQYHRFYVLRRL